MTFKGAHHRASSLKCPRSTYSAVMEEGPKHHTRYLIRFTLGFDECSYFFWEECDECVYVVAANNIHSGSDNFFRL